MTQPHFGEKFSALSPSGLANSGRWAFCEPAWLQDEGRKLLSHSEEACI